MKYRTKVRELDGKMTREHRAWEMLIRRLDYLNSFGGNRSEMEKTTRIVAQIWDDAGHEEEKPSGKHSCKDGQRG
jgi:hypothetical protein